MRTGIRRLSVDQYDQMVANGVLPETNRFELIGGRLVEKMTKGEKHSASCEYCWRLIHALLPPGWHVRIEKPVRIPTRRSEPEPDVSVARGSARDYARAPSRSRRCDSRCRGDPHLGGEDRKLAPIYAAAASPSGLDCQRARARLEVYESPIEGTYPAPKILGEADAAQLLIDGKVVGHILRGRSAAAARAPMSLPGLPRALVLAGRALRAARAPHPSRSSAAA